VYMKSAGMEGAMCTGMSLPKCAGMTSRLHLSLYFSDAAGFAATFG